MKSVALSVWIFINLICFGMCGYFYLIWSQYWMSLEKQRLFSKPTVKQERNRNIENPIYINDILNNPKGFSYKSIQNKSLTAQTLRNNHNKTRRDIQFNNYNIFSQKEKYIRYKKNANIVKRNGGRPRFPNLDRSFIELDSKKYQCEIDKPEKCSAKVEEYKSLLLREFKRILMDEGNILKTLSSSNPYNVQYNVSKHGNYREKDTRELLCELKSKQIRTITALDAPFAALGFGKRIPKFPLLKHNFFNSCAIVTSSGALLGSNLGDFIDTHDLVLRFNHAPTKNYTQDVGSKTTIRVINSQVVSKKHFKFLTSKMYKDISILAWDPSNYSASLYDWYQKPDYNLFPEYRRYMRKHPNADFHILNPRSLWNIWDFIQTNSPYKLRRNPPSSGFIGLSVLLPYCSFVDVFEYVPSARLTSRCHYYDSQDDSACTFGIWHPLAAEKSVAYCMNSATDFTVFQAGYLRIQGYQHLDCY